MKMKCLIDADILSYEISSCGQYYEPEDVAREHLVVRDFDYVAGLLDQKIREIVAECNSDEEPTLYLTGDEHLLKHTNRDAKFKAEEIKVFTPNFRVDTAKAKPYKGTRKQEKPFHFHNLRAYMLSEYDCIVANGMEADDLICVHMTEYRKDTVWSGGKPEDTSVICCTRDKDLRMCPGWHYGWKCGKQEQFGPEFVDELGYLEISSSSPRKIKGTGLKFFFSQLITGDTVDNIPGLPKRGPVFAYDLLSNCTSEGELRERVGHAYEQHHGEAYWNALREQVDLLWMIRELNEDGSLKFYEWPQGGVLSDDQEVKIQDVGVSGLKLSSDPS